MKDLIIPLIATLLISSCSCNKKDPGLEKDKRIFYDTEQFVMGADLSYVNQILDFGGEYSDSAIVKDPYRIFSQYGCNVVRLRLFHNPIWTKEIYGAEGTQMYNDYNDVKRAIVEAKNNGMAVCLDFHYSDSWADPGKQVPPAAWDGLALQELHDSIYNYTYATLTKLATEGLMPEYVQLGNEINPGFVLPEGERWNNNAADLVYLLNSAIKGVRDAGNSTVGEAEIIIHVAQPENILLWFDGLATLGLTDYDIVGMSYYYIWSAIQIGGVSDQVRQIRIQLNKDVMVMETAFPFTTENADNYGNIIGGDKLPVSGFNATIDDQYNYLVRLTQEIIDGGGKGIFYWEPAWISSDIKTQWGQGSAWDCNTFFNFEGDVIKSMNYMTSEYDFQP